MPSESRSSDNNVIHQENSKDDKNSNPCITEMRFGADNISILDAMFLAMNECQTLHPDPQDSFSDGKYILSYLDFILKKCM